MQMWSPRSRQGQTDLHGDTEAKLSLFSARVSVEAALETDRYPG